MEKLLDQSFSTDNFRKIFDYENRKGQHLEGKFFPEIEKITKNLKNFSLEFRELENKRPKISKQLYEEERAKINKNKNDLKDHKERLLISELEKISADILKKNFRITLQKVVTKNGKEAYKISNDSASYFVIKQIQYNIKRLYKIQQGNRYNIICQLRSLMKDSFPKYIIRTDIKKFYESISRNSLLNKINKEHLLAMTSKKIIQQVLMSYKDLSHNDIGIPRGIGISAYLSEIYMRDFDKKIRSHPEIIFYARYVDDMVIVFSPKLNSNTTNFLSQIMSEAEKLDLTLNSNKTKTLDLRNLDLKNPQKDDLDYLGYRFCKDKTIQMGTEKIEKYKIKIERTFNAYIKGCKTKEKVARKILVKRLKFLTGNTKLINNKKHVLVGIYFSNSLITNTDCLDHLDEYLSKKISNISCDRLKERLTKMSFKEGFLQKRFTKFSTTELSKIVEVWKRVT
jgi:hypothetical protein